MKISEDEGRLLGAVQLNAEASIARLSQITGLREHTIRYQLRKFHDVGLIRKRAMVNVHLTGLMHHSVLFGYSPTERGAEDRLLEFLVRSPHTSDVFEIGGDFQFGAVVAVPDIVQFFEIIRAISSLRGVSINHKAITARMSTTLYRRKYLGQVVGGVDSITYARTGVVAALDDTDRRILLALSTFGSISRRELARRLSIPHTTVNERIGTLEKKGVILGYVYGISTELLGIQAFRLLLQLPKNTVENAALLHRFGLECPEVLALMQTVGQWDFEYEIEVRDPRQVNGVVQQLYARLDTSGVKVTVVPQFRFLKAGSYPFTYSLGEIQEN